MNEIFNDKGNDVGLENFQVELSLAFWKGNDTVCLDGAAAAQRLLEVAQQATYEAFAVQDFLMAIYEPALHHFNLRRLRDVDAYVHSDCLAVLRMEYAPLQSFARNFSDGGAALKAMYRNLHPQEHFDYR